MSLPTVVPETASVDTGSVRLGARRWPGGSGRPVLLVHGLSSNARLWDLVAVRLAETGHPVLAVDLRGHGSSAAVADGSTDPTRTAAGDLAAVCSQIARDRRSESQRGHPGGGLSTTWVTTRLLPGNIRIT